MTFKFLCSRTLQVLSGIKPPLAHSETIIILKPANMTRIVNRVREKLRPQDPQDLDFEVISTLQYLSFIFVYARLIQ